MRGREQVESGLHHRRADRPEEGRRQEVTLDCSQFTDVIASCQTDLSGCEADLASCESATHCGDGTIDDGEQCDSGSLDGQSCVGLGFLGGELTCTAACAFSTEDCESPRFEVTARGTILDHQTGLEWERKDASDSIADLANPHDADNKYQWSGAALAGPDGSAFLVFLAKLNEAWATYIDDLVTRGCYAGRCDWRLPTVEELRSIAVQSCGAPPCVIDPVFLPAPSAAVYTMTRVAHDPVGAWAVDFSNGFEANTPKSFLRSVRAVRGGSPGVLTDCGDSGRSVRGYCWYLGAAGDSCSEACAAEERTSDEATFFLAGSSGDAEVCQQVLDALVALGLGLDQPNATGSAGVGCSVHNLSSVRSRVTTPETTAGAAAADIRRACACKQ